MFRVVPEMRVLSFGLSLPSKLICSFFLLTSIAISSVQPLRGDESSDVEPKAIFNPLFVGDQKVMDFFYAPWGNRSEENATVARIRIGGGAFYSKIAYYGESPLELWATDDSSPEGIVEISYSFKSSSITKKEILMIKLLGQGKSQVSPIDFSDTKIPLGSILFQSYANEDLYFSAGKEKFKLAPRKGYLFRASDNSLSSNIMILGYLNRNGNYKTASKQVVRNLHTQRGVILLRSERESIKSMKLMESSRKFSNIVGLGSQPFTPMPLPPESDEAGNPRLEGFPKEN
jgi:hypothetical protein